jgi:hypothetical protein
VKLFRGDQEQEDSALGNRRHPVKGQTLVGICRFLSKYLACGGVLVFLELGDRLPRRHRPCPWTGSDLVLEPKLQVVRLQHHVEPSLPRTAWARDLLGDRPGQVFEVVF